MTGPGIAILPAATDDMLAAIERAGGRAVEPGAAAGVIWTNPRDPQGLKDELASSPAGWVQLPFAGIESFFEAGVIDPSLTWTCAKGIYGPACAEHALALVLAASRRLQVHARAHAWRTPGLGSPERRLQGATVLIFGAGGIGRALIPMVRPLDVEVVAVNRSGVAVDGAARTVTTAELHDVLPGSDYVVVTAALTPETAGIFGDAEFAAMRDDAWIVNVARGGLIDTGSLVTALRDGVIGGAALDVTDPEPLPEDHPLWDLDNALITPHIANTWDMALPELTALIERNVARFAAGEELEGLVDPKLGY